LYVGCFFAKRSRAGTRHALHSLHLELDHDAAKRRVADIPDRVDHRRAEGWAVGYGLHELRRLAVRPLLKPGPVQLDDDPLAVAVPRAGIAVSEFFFEDKKILAVVADRVFLRRDEFAGRFAFIDTSKKDPPSRSSYEFPGRFGSGRPEMGSCAQSASRRT
jgi:hypothetical protein